MNIEKLVKRLKEFTLDDIELIAECDCKTKLEQLLNSNKILFENGIYKYNEETKTGENYEIFSPQKNKHLKISIEDAKDYFMKNYVKKYCKFETYRNYNAIFNFNIIPFINCYYLHEIDIESIKELFKVCELRRLKPRRIKNTMALLNQLIKDCFDLYIHKSNNWVLYLNINCSGCNIRHRCIMLFLLCHQHRLLPNCHQQLDRLIPDMF